MFTQLNQYHVVMEVEARSFQRQAPPNLLNTLYVRSAAGGHGAAEPDGALTMDTTNVPRWR